MKKISRRKFVIDSAQATALALVAPVLLQAKEVGTFSFSQIALPYAYNALEPHIDAQTMEIHYTKHHAAYVKNVNDAIASEKISFQTEADFFSHVSKLSPKVHNNAGGAWNHNFFWQIMKPHGGGAPTGKIGDAITGSFGSFDKFKEEFTKAAMGRFGSGWAWLVQANGKLKIGSSPNQDNPLMDTSELKGTPLLGLDVWEHAYYLKYQNKRNEYVANWWNTLNWDEVAKRLA
ncbi:MAG: superoxide dismutase [Bacteroidetes bacterium]|nr:superoxide dismutase [Bacteroidota bacterium]